MSMVVVAVHVPEQESFREFKDSFSYGSRNDLSFKFLKRLDDSDAAEFLRLLIAEVGALFDGVDPQRLIDLVYEWQVRAYRPGSNESRPYVYENGPFQPVSQPLADITLGLVTSSGHFVVDDDPSPLEVPGMTQDEAMAHIDDFLRSTPELSEIPIETANEDLRVRHPGYDIRSTSIDPGVTFPLSLLVSAAAERRIGRLAPMAYSFVGACAQGRIRKEAPGWVERWKVAGVQALFLVPV